VPPDWFAGNITLFAFDAGEELSEHTAPFDALVLTLSGALTLTIGGVNVRTSPQTIVLMPANVFLTLCVPPNPRACC
jgi:quercetin dioxygenase-like cupin family protein